jgi:predicted ATPase
VLLVLDNCEHIVAAAASLAARVLRTAPGVHILATSREPLRVEGERLVRLPRLASPPPETHIAAEEALKFPAVQLFVGHAASSTGAFVLTDHDAPVVAEICRKLDGLPLAIEFAAARAGVLGVRRVAACLEHGPQLLAGGRRMASPRQQSLVATLDWSYDRLGPAEQIIFRRLAVFPGSFTLHAAARVAGNEVEGEGEMIEAIAGLVAKSLLISNTGTSESRFSLLETTRAYALLKLGEAGETKVIRRRYAEYYRDMFEPAAPDTAEAHSHVEHAEIVNIREALKWAFAPGGDPAIGVALTVASAPVWLALSQFDEFRNWMGKAATALSGQQMSGHDTVVPFKIADLPRVA